MAAGLHDAILSLVHDKGISEDLIKQTIEEFLLAAYKRKFGTADNAVVQFSDDGDEVSLFAKKLIVEDLEDPITEIALDEALELNEDCEPGDELLIEIDPKEFDRIAVQSAKQKARQSLRDIQKDTLYSEYKGKEGEMIIGYYQREKNGDLFIDVGKTEAILPKRFQSPREFYHQGDRLKVLIQSVEKSPRGLSIVLSRTHTDFVKKLFEIEVPEIYDHTIEIYKIVREPGYRTKLAVYSNRDDVDPVGACVGLKGTRIQAIVKELEGEKIDILKYETDPRNFIKNALSPAEVRLVYILDEAKRSALAVVGEGQLSLAIGKQGLNVRLANRLADWNIDVKTESQFAEMDINVEFKRDFDALFSSIDEEGEYRDIENISDIPEISEDYVELLRNNGIESIESFINTDNDQLLEIEGIDEKVLQELNDIVNEYVDIVEENDNTDDEQEEEDDLQIDEEEIDQPEEEVESESEEELPEGEEEEVEETFECPECGGEITIHMETCPSCGVGLSFEFEDEEEEEE